MDYRTHRETFRTVEGSTYTLRHFSHDRDYQACVRLEKDIWGHDFEGCVPPAMLEIPQKVGGVSAGAFTPDNRLVAMVFGFTGIMKGELCHWSHMLAVDPAHRGTNLGLRLKMFQRTFLLELGVTKMRWTFDPLESRNAHLNMNQLWARPESYGVDVYGTGSTSTLHALIGTDRLFVLWVMDAEPEEIKKSRFPRSLAKNAPIINDHVPLSGFEASSPLVRIEVPENIQKIKGEDPDMARQWRLTTRAAFLHCLENGFQIHDYYRDLSDHRCFYVLSRAEH